MPLPRPPSADPLVALADQCVQCGLCLPACPTYRQQRIEAESPRGRIALARAWALDALEPTPAGEAHLDACLGCRNCESACPAGVRYGALLVEARTRQRARRAADWRQRALEALVARPRWLGRLLTLYRLVYGLLPTGWRPLPRPPAPEVVTTAPEPGDAPTPGATGERDDGSLTPRGRAALFIGCAAASYEAPTRDALRRLLDACGIDVVEPAGQGCCGSLHRHAGDAATADRLAATNGTAFAGAPLVLTLASGCHEAVAAAHAGGTRDALEELARHLDRLRLRPFAGRVAVHLPCTLRNGVRSVGALRRLLAAVPGLDAVELDAGPGCCGASGSGLLVDPARAATFRAPLLEQAQALDATIIVSANLGCRLHLANGTTIPVMHPVDFLAAQLDMAPRPRA